MDKSPNLQLNLTPEDAEGSFRAWRLAENGPDAGSNMMILDRVVGAILTKANAPLTWAMLRDGFSLLSDGSDEETEPGGE